MKKILLIALLAILSTTSAYADRGYGHGGGWGWGGLWVVPALIGTVVGSVAYGLTRPLYAQPAPYYAPSYPTNYAPNYAPNYPPAYAAPVASASWYFCPASNAYYPYVTQCPSGWQAVSPTPPVAPPQASYNPPPPPGR